MKIVHFLKIVLLLVTTLFASSSTARLFCSNACDFQIAFVNGGSIEAVESLTITFGDGGLVDTGSTSMAYVDGQALSLVAGESLVFSEGGQFHLGSGGNIDATSVIFNVDGNALLGDTAGGEVTLWSDSALNIQNGGGLTLNSGLTVNGTLDLSAGVLQPASVGSITLGKGLIYPGTNSLVVNSSTNMISGGTISLTALTVDDLVNLQGFELPTANGGNCTVQDASCIDTQGQRYSLVEGQFVLVNESVGSSGLFDWMMISVLLLLLFRQSRLTLDG